eukprot:m.137366 g.137366  ORF g.137366 m.137366 type:complete len:414 (+) comp22676_c0_seq1:278-1519(+)
MGDESSSSSSSSSSDEASNALLPLQLLLHSMQSRLRQKSAKKKNKKRKRIKRKRMGESADTDDEDGGAAGAAVVDSHPTKQPRNRSGKAEARAKAKSSHPTQRKRAMIKREEEIESDDDENLIDTFAKATELIRKSKRIVILCGAGISVSCGIPDFRSPTGLYATLASLGLPVAEPEDLMDINTFVDTPELFYSFAKKIWPDGSILPSLTHRFFKLLVDKRKLLRIYTQNIDGLEEAAGVPKAKITYCHGNLRTARCLKCKRKASAADLAPIVAKGEVPYCVKCPGGTGVMKPDMVFFGERVSGDVVGKMTKESAKVDLVIVMGTSLAVAPMSRVLDLLPASVPRLLLNRDLITNRCTTPLTAALLGDADSTIHHLITGLGWVDDCLEVASVETPPPLPRVVVLGTDATAEVE